MNLVASWTTADGREFYHFDTALAAAWLESSATGKAVDVFVNNDGGRELVASVTNHEGGSK